MITKKLRLSLMFGEHDDNISVEVAYNFGYLPSQTRFDKLAKACLYSILISGCYHPYVFWLCS